MDMVGIQILHTENEVLYTIRHETLPTLKYVGIVGHVSIIHTDHSWSLGDPNLHHSPDSQTHP